MTAVGSARQHRSRTFDTSAFACSSPMTSANCKISCAPQGPRRACYKTSIRRCKRQSPRLRDAGARDVSSCLGDGTAPRSSLNRDREGDRTMAKADGMFLYLGTYSSEAATGAGRLNDIVKDLHAADAVGAPTTRRSSPRTRRARCTSTRTRWRTRHGAGVARRPVPSSASCSRQAILGSAIVGGAVGATSGHIWRGISRSDVKELAQLIDSGQAALSRWWARARSSKRSTRPD